MQGLFLLLEAEGKVAVAEVLLLKDIVGRSKVIGIHFNYYRSN
jgi:hypothetical protein